MAIGGGPFRSTPSYQLCLIGAIDASRSIAPLADGRL
jgi:hypothetical protein